MKKDMSRQLGAGFIGRVAGWCASFPSRRVAPFTLLALALGAATQTAEAAANWTGNASGELANVNNYQTDNKTWSIYCNSDNLTGNKRTSLWIKKDLAEFKLEDSSAVYKGLFFQKGMAWEFHSNLDDGRTKICLFDNSGGSDICSCYDRNDGLSE